jgi:putative flippase GtrA
MSTTTRLGTTTMAASCGNRNTIKSPSPMLARWCKFNLVGGVGIAVQFAALFILKSVLDFNYLAATALAVEAAVLHNFVWHEHFTWDDRTKVGRTQPIRNELERTNLVPMNPLQMNWVRTKLGQPKPRHQISDRQSSFSRFLRFSLSNGAISIFGNLALMKLMVGQGHLNYLFANAVAIVLCSLANFLVSEMWVFQRR